MHLARDTCRFVATLILALPILLGLNELAGAGEPAAGGAVPAGRLTQAGGPAGCIHARGTNRCARGRAVTSPQEIALSPDGRHAYVASYGSNAIAVFARDRRTGELDQLSGRRGCVRHEGGGSCSARKGDCAPELDRGQPRRGKRLRHGCRQRRARRVRSRPANWGPSPAGRRVGLPQPAPRRRVRGRPGAERADQRGRESRRRSRVCRGTAFPERGRRACALCQRQPDTAERHRRLPEPGRPRRLRGRTGHVVARGGGG